MGLVAGQQVQRAQEPLVREEVEGERVLLHPDQVAPTEPQTIQVDGIVNTVPLQMAGLSTHARCAKSDGLNPPCSGDLLRALSQSR